MDINHLHLYVDEPRACHQWWVENCSFQSVPELAAQFEADSAVQRADIRLLFSGATAGGVGAHSPVDEFLRRYSPGVADVAFRVRDLDCTLAQVRRAGGQVLRPPQAIAGLANGGRWGRIQGWGGLVHTLIDPGLANRSRSPEGFSDARSPLPWQAVDHAVLNVAAHHLEAAASWYERTLGFCRQQQFAIQTPNSGLNSLVLRHPEGTATLPINEPTSPNSQVQEFLDYHGGAGIQHVALRTHNLVQTVAVLRRRGVQFLTVPPTYYEQLRQRPGFWHGAGDWAAIARHQILVDWLPDCPQARLLQTFTQPLFERPTFFLELIERQMVPSGSVVAEGFGEGNFQALFEAIEREQRQRGSL